MMRRQREATSRQQAAGQLADYQHAVREVTEVLRRHISGDLEARVGPLPDHDELRALRDAVNDATDVGDAFVRESSAALRSASDGEYHRRFLTRGLHGRYREAARGIDDACGQIQAADESAGRAESDRLSIAGRVQEVAVQVAAASTELGASSENLAASTQLAVDRAEAAIGIVRSLETASQEIGEAVTLIKRVASQTRLLALNATIEAARAAESGRGFGVVASEVRSLADEVHRSSDDIAVRIADAIRSASAAGSSIREIADIIAHMDQQVGGVAVAASGDADGQQGLAHMAELLRTETIRLTAG